MSRSKQISSLCLLLLSMLASNVVWANPSTYCGSIFYDLYLPGKVSVGVVYKKNRIQIETPRTRIMLTPNFSRHQAVALRDRFTHEAIGEIGVQWNMPGQMHLPLYIQFNHQTEGYATEAKYALIKFIFSTTSATSIYEVIPKENVASQALHRKLGFRLAEKSDLESGDYQLDKIDFLKDDQSVPNQFLEFALPNKKFVKMNLPHLPDESYQLLSFFGAVQLALDVWANEIESAPTSYKSANRLVAELKRHLVKGDSQLLRAHAHEIEMLVRRGEPFSNLEKKYEYIIRHSKNDAERRLVQVLKQILLDEAIRLGVASYRTDVVVQDERDEHRK